MSSNLVNYFLELVQIDSESKNERAIVDRLKADLVNLGFSVEEDASNQKTGGNAGNIYAFLPGKKDCKPILFCAHVDTVVPGRGIKPIVNGDKITSDGKTILGADDKTGVAQIVYGIKDIIESQYDYPPIEVLFTISEEIGLLGARYFDKSKLKSDIGYALDTEEIGEFMIGAPSQNTIKITVRGKESHAGAEPEKGINAIRVAAEAIASCPMGRIDFETTANIGVIHGGMATNIVPNLVEIKGETRSHNMEKLARVTNDITDAFYKAASKHKLEHAEAKVEIEVHNEYKAFFMDESHKVVQVGKLAAERIGLTPLLLKGGGGSDANIINAEGKSMIIVGTGMHSYHTVDEFTTITELEKGKELISEIIKVYAEC
jgi:tripeptide aminopeptidase